MELTDEDEVMASDVDVLWVELDAMDGVDEGVD